MRETDFWKNRVREGAVLNPIDRTSEVLFGLIMVLTFTGAISVATDGREEVKELLWAALGCNVAWGLVDAVMYWMNVLLERGRNVKIMGRMRSAKNVDDRGRVLSEELPPALGSLLTPEELKSISTRIIELPEPEKKDLLTIRDFYSGLQIFLLVFLCTLPVALPFALIQDVALAIRVSNGVALTLLFIGGYRLARYAGFRPLLTGLVYALIGVLLVALTMMLGG